MTDDILLRDLEKHIKQTKELISWLEQVYYNSAVTSLFDQPFLSMLTTGARFVETNLELLQKQYLTK